jgi:NAD(P)-dependent dehydrogenase (short-subunit alcohol dehydrogenase family)
MTLDGKRIVVLGGSSGIGLATAQAAALEGASVVIASSRKTRVDQALATLPAGAEGHVLDLTDADAMQKLFARLGSLDHLVFTAGETLQLGNLVGLSICRSIIDAHGGRLWADMNASRGAVFRFTLPGVDKELTNSRSPAHLTREPHGDTVSDAAQQPAYEGNKRPHRSRRGRGQPRRGRQ